MGKGKTKRNTRDLILDAAETIVDRDGVNSLTFDALAAEQPLEIMRTIHSFDPCMSCAVHLLDTEGQELQVVVQ